MNALSSNVGFLSNPGSEIVADLNVMASNGAAQLLMYPTLLNGAVMILLGQLWFGMKPTVNFFNSAEVFMFVFFSVVLLCFFGVAGVFFSLYQIQTNYCVKMLAGT